jgi:hypothetical protein
MARASNLRLFAHVEGVLTGQKFLELPFLGHRSSHSGHRPSSASALRSMPLTTDNDTAVKLVLWQLRTVRTMYRDIRPSLRHAAIFLVSPDRYQSLMK